MRASGLVSLAAICVIGGAFASAQLVAQAVPPEDERPTADIAFGVTMNGPKDVNRPPRCTELALPCLTPRTFPDFGVAVQAAAHIGQHAAIAAEASTYVNRWDTTAAVGAPLPRSNHATALLAGPRLTTGLRHLTSTDKQGYRAFAQVLAGTEASTVLPTRFAVQPGAGVDVHLSAPGLWIRVSGDYRWTRGGPRNLSGSRVLGALVVAR